MVTTQKHYPMRLRRRRTGRFVRTILFVATGGLSMLFIRK